MTNRKLGVLRDGFLASIPIVFMEYHSASFLADFLPRMLQSHVLYSGLVRFPHRGELALVGRLGFLRAVCLRNSARKI